MNKFSEIIPPERLEMLANWFDQVQEACQTDEGAETVIAHIRKWKEYSVQEDLRKLAEAMRES